MYGLGELEAAVMQVLWHASEPVTVRDVLGKLDTGKPLAYTTVLTVLDNLHRKGWVQRTLVGKAYWYRPVHSMVETATRSLRAVLDESGDPEAVLLDFVSSASDHESELLRKALRERGPD
ncbi:putative transcriptional regulator [Kibdelosporangium sp. 4NS15]|uniref:Transcriptional regulator n=1 Tax=Kibdelosporangium persicum TaxID=2698649 RepID=A0ABX2FCR8_9PSEU|nr:BlaI/MecI/CopY family transcriptional regulator [Kibdelosporangium persicum]NRN69154.1 putative transcriptional regulator [Kibdelosporangium persicum]